MIVAIALKSHSVPKNGLRSDATILPFHGHLGSGRDLRAKGRQPVPKGERLILEMPGGGGYGDPKAREPERVREDVRNGLVSAEAAERDYGVEAG